MKEFTKSCKYCGIDFHQVLDNTCNTGTDHHRTCDLAFKAGMLEAARIARSYYGRNESGPLTIAEAIENEALK